MKTRLSLSSVSVSGRVAALAFAALAALFAGCSTTESVKGPPKPDATGVSRLKGDVAIQKGMTKQDVIEQLGYPAEVEEVVRDGAKAEIWTYKIERTVASTIESDGEQERVYLDHKTGQLVTVREPIYRNEAVKSLTTTKLLFVGEELVAFKDEVQGGILQVGG